LDKSSKQTKQSAPRSLIRSAIDIPIQHKEKDNRVVDDEWEAIINKNHSIKHKSFIHFDNLDRF